MVHTLTARLYKVKSGGLGPSWAVAPHKKKDREQRIVAYRYNRPANTPDLNRHT